MSTPEQPATPALTRKQLRDIRNTGSTPIVTGDEPAEAQQAASENAPDSGGEPAPRPEVTDSPAPAHVAAPLPRAAEPVAVHDLPGADASVDLGVQPLTRRQARQQERIRTASVPVITPEVAAAHAASVAAASRDESEAPVDEVSADAPSGSVSLAEIFGVEPTEPHADVTEDQPADARARARRKTSGRSTSSSQTAPSTPTNPTALWSTHSSEPSCWRASPSRRRCRPRSIS